MGDRPLLARVDVGILPGLEQKSRHVLREELAGLGIHHVETVVIDEHRLLSSPICPALAADFSNDSLSNLSRKWRFLETFARLTATRACNSCH
jgi:hypothetical protein